MTIQITSLKTYICYNLTKIQKNQGAYQPNCGYVEAQ